MMNVYKPNDRNRSKKQQDSLNKRRKSSNENETNTENITAIAGNWIVAIGTIVSAIGVTPSTILTQQTREDFHLIGQILEAGGIALVSKTEDTLLFTVGDQLQAIGNLTVVASILSENEQTAQLLEKKGNLIQVVGLGLVINTEGHLTLLQTLYNIGIIIQLIGTSIEALANTDTEEGEIMLSVGAWIKAVGAILTVLATE